MRSITFIIGPILFLRVFSWFIDPKHGVHLPGAPYYLAAALLFAAMLLSMQIKQPDMTAEGTAPSPEIPADVSPEGIAASEAIREIDEGERSS
jgi:hypothetical protein